MKKLIIFDLNGVLIDRERTLYNKDETLSFRIRNTSVWVRPNIDKLFEYVFEHFDVGVWSCCNEENTTSLVEKVFGTYKDELIFVFNGNHCRGLSKKEKRLSFIWKRFPKYNKTNTLIIDDTIEKVSMNPLECIYNVSTWKKGGSDTSELLEYIKQL